MLILFGLKILIFFQVIEIIKAIFKEDSMVSVVWEMLLHWINKDNLSNTCTWFAYNSFIPKSVSKPSLYQTYKQHDFYAPHT